MNDIKEEEQRIANITVIAKVEYLPAVIDFVRYISSKLGLGDRDVKRLELVVEEACLNVIEHAFDPDEIGTFDVIILRKPGKIVVAVEDQGLPFDFKKFKTGKESGLGMVLMRAFADEIYFINLGHHGKRVELIKLLPYKDIEAYISEEEKGKVISLPPVPKDIPLNIRLMTQDDSVNMARCIYRSYGYSYGWDFIYYPERVKELLQSGLLTSCVTLNPGEEIVGHFAMMIDHKDSQVGETGMAVVDPRYRGRGLFKQMKEFMVKYAQEKGMYGIYSEAVAVHPYSQKGNISIGAHETGLLLGLVPATMFFKKIQKEHKKKRQSAVLFYLKVKDSPIQDVYPPFHHSSMIRSIYEKNNLKRNIKDASKLIEHTELPQNAQIDVKVHTDLNSAFMRIIQYGKDIEDLARFRLKELCLRRIDCIYLDLPLTHPATQKFCASIEILGFFFGGVIPEMFDGDVLRLQYLNNVDIDLNSIVVVSDFGKELFDYITLVRNE